MNQTLARNSRLPSLLLAAALQISPVVRAALPVTQNAANLVVILLRWAAGGMAAAGSVQAVSGASTVVSTPHNVKGTNGIPFSLRLLTAPHSSQYWTANNLPPGLALTGRSGNSSWKIQGTPTAAGTFLVRVTAKETAQSSPGRTVSATLVLTILPATNSASVAIFPPTGIYKGLFYDSNHLQHASSGFITLTVRPGGAFKAQLQNGTRKFAGTGRFNDAGRTTNLMSHPGGGALTVELKADGQDHSRITGRVTDGTWSAGLLALRASFNAATNPATGLAGSYTLLIPGAPEGTPAPFGDGFGSLKVNAGGATAFTGRLADGSRLLQRAGLSGAGDWPLYVSLYGGRGAVLGWLRVHPASGLDLDGAAHWIRPAGPVPKLYTNGFTLASPVIGSLYTPPVGGILETNSALVILSGGNFSEANTNVVTLAAAGRVINAGSNLLTFAVTPATGLFKGTVKLPHVTRPVRFQGAVLRGVGVGGGYFLGSNEVGNVYFGP